MTPHDHNRTVGILHGLIGILVLTGLIVAAMLEAGRRPSDATERLVWVLYVLPIPLLHILAAYGIFTLKRWGRILALLLSVFYVLIFPLGTLLAIYTWWVLYGENGRQLYNLALPAEQHDR
jgi:hypothetical protein